MTPATARLFERRGVDLLQPPPLHVPLELLKKQLPNPSHLEYCLSVSTVKEIQEAIPKLSRHEIEAVRDWIDEYLEDQLELKDEVKAKLDQSRREIASGEYKIRQPK